MSSFARTPALIATLGGATALTVGVGVMAAVAASSAHTATYHLDSSWGSGYQAEYTIKNTGATATHGWKLEFDLPSGQKLSSAWGGSAAVSGPSGPSGQHVTVSAASWNTDLAPGSVTVVGFVASGSGSPTGCLIDGVSCAGGATTPTSPTPTTPTTPTTPKPTGPATTTPPTTAVPTAPSTGGVPAAAPYVDTSLYPPFDLVGTSRATGVKVFNLAFLVARGGCTPAWGGVTALADDAVASQIGALRSAGGDVRVSFGGAAGSELAQACSSASALASAYRSAITAYGLTKIDFDVEGAAITDAAANARRATAVANLQREAAEAGRGLEVSLTLPVLPSGLTQDGLNVVSGMKAAGVNVSTVNVMAMDYGDWAAPSPAGKMGQYAIQSATSTQAQVKQIFGGTDAQAWKRVAVTPMIGVNDTSNEVFTVADAQQLVAFARTVHLGWLSMWSAGRDQACPGGPKSYADATCSSIAQTARAFSTTLAGYAG